MALARDALGEVGKALRDLGRELETGVELDRACGGVSSELRVVLLDLAAADRLELGLGVVQRGRAEHLNEGNTSGAVVRCPVTVVEATG